MDIGLEFQAGWDDVDVIDVRISAWNGTFGGTTNIYVGVGELEEAAATLRGFPNDSSDTRELKFANLGMGAVAVLLAYGSTALAALHVHGCRQELNPFMIQWVLQSPWFCRCR